MATDRADGANGACEPVEQQDSTGGNFRGAASVDQPMISARGPTTPSAGGELRLRHIGRLSYVCGGNLDCAGSQGLAMSQALEKRGIIMTNRPKRRGRCPRLSLWLILIVGTLWLTPDRASASVFNSAGTGEYDNSGDTCSGNNPTGADVVNIRRYNLINGLGSVVVNRINYIDANTDIDADDVPLFEDIRIIDGDFSAYCGEVWHPGSGGGGTVIAMASCVTAFSRCTYHEIRVDTSWTATASTYDKQRIICHELGHTFGLMHPASVEGCVGSTTNNGYSPHEINDHLNSVW